MITATVEEATEDGTTVVLRDGDKQLVEVYLRRAPSLSTERLNLSVFVTENSGIEWVTPKEFANG